MPQLAPDLAQERNARDEALARANALFRSAPKAEESEEPAEEAAAEIPAEQPEVEAAEAVEAEAAPVEAAPAEAAAVPSATEAVEEPVVAVAPEAVVAEAAPAAAAPVETPEPIDAEAAERERLDAIRQKHDIRSPKILGKIELQKVEPRKTESKREGRKTTFAVSDLEQPAAATGKPAKGKKVRAAEEGSEADGLKKRRPKKQILRKDDLLDYEGERDTWRSRKDKKDKQKKSDLADGQRTLVKQVKINNEVSAGEFAKAMGVKGSEVLTQLMNLGVMATINQLLDYDTASLVAGQFGVTVVNTGQDDEQMLSELRTTDTPDDLKLRPPVVTVMGHVDHGKTSLLDVIRKTSVVKGEAGGITQHIGAYNVVLPHGGSVTFLDTPGHEAFTAMRSRGARVTDIVVLVIAADDGVMPQTIEAINHAKAAGVPIIVAVNKIDKEGANIDRIKTQLSEHGLIPEDWGGDTIMVPVSAKTKIGIDLLLENLYAQAEILELKANPSRHAYGTIVESKLDRGRGPVMTVLVSNGTLRRGDCFVAGSVFGKVRAMLAGDGQAADEAGPSIPVEVVGASTVPLAGDDFYVLASEAEARNIAETRARAARLKELSARNKVAIGGPLTLESFSARVAEGEKKEFPLIVKADVQGSVEAVSEALLQLSNEEVSVTVLHKGVGAVTENDVQLAVASRALVVAFNIRAESHAAQMAENEGVHILYSRIIYELVDAVKGAVSGVLAPQIVEKTLGRVEVRQTFKVPKAGVVAGSYVLDGVVQRGAMIRLLRDNRVIHEGKMSSLRRFKDDVREVQAGYECGIGIDGYNDIKDGDVIEVFKMEEVARTI